MVCTEHVLNRIFVKDMNKISVKDMNRISVKVEVDVLGTSP